MAAATTYGIPGALLRVADRCGQAAEPGAAALVGEVRRSDLVHTRSLVDLALAQEAVGRAIAILRGPVPATCCTSHPACAATSTSMCWWPRAHRSSGDGARGAGVPFLDAICSLMRRLMVTQMRVLAPSGGLVDLHGALLNGR